MISALVLHRGLHICFYLAMAMRCAWAQASETDYDRAMAAFEVGELASAGKIADHLLDQAKDADSRALALMIRVRIACAQGPSKDAVAALRHLASSADSLTTTTRIALAETECAVGLDDEAMTLADSIGAASPGLPRAHAAAVIAAARVHKGDFADALKAIDLAIDAAANADISNVEKAFRDRLQRQRRGIADASDLNTHGLGFWLYRQARRERLLDHDYQKALDDYSLLLKRAEANRGKPTVIVTGPDDPRVADLPVHPAYIEAARFDRAVCLHQLGDHRGSALALQEMAGDATGPYCGESLRILGDLALEIDEDSAAAAKHYTDALHWFSGLKERHFDEDRCLPPGQSREITKPAAAMKAVTGWNDTNWFTPKPEQVYNPVSCTWYGDYQVLQAQTRRALCEFILGKLPQALEDIDAFRTLDAIDRHLTDNGMPSNYLRLRDDFSAGRMYATKEEIALFNDTGLTTALLFAEFLFETEQWPDAEARYRALLDRRAQRLSADAKAYLTYALSVTLVYQDKQEESGKLLADFDGRFAKSPTWPRAKFIQADLILNGPARWRILEEVWARCAHTDWGREGVQRLGMNQLAFRDLPAATKTFQALLKEAPADSEFHLIAEKFLAAIRYEELHPDK